MRFSTYWKRKWPCPAFQLNINWSRPKPILLAGWDSSRLSKWNTRSLWEPNHNMACEERKADENKRVSFTQPGCQSVSKQGDKDNILVRTLWLFPRNFLPSLTQEIYKGSILRYPILANQGTTFSKPALSRQGNNCWEWTGPDQLTPPYIVRL